MQKSEENLYTSIESKSTSKFEEDQFSVECEVFGVTDQAKFTWNLNGENVNYFVEKTEIFPMNSENINQTIPADSDTSTNKQKYHMKQTIKMKEQVRLDKTTLNCTVDDFILKVFKQPTL